MSRAAFENFHQLGIGDGLLYNVDRALNKMSGGRSRVFKYVLVAQPVPPDGGDGLRPSTINSIRRVAADDPVVSSFPRSPRVISKRFDSGSACFVAEVRGRFAGYLWLAFGGYDEDEVRCRYEFQQSDVCAWDYDVYVEPQFRMGRTFARLWQAANRELASRGILWCCSRISAFNPHSVAAHQRLGIKKLFSATFICIGRLQFALFGTFPFVHPSFWKVSRPTLRLRVPVMHANRSVPS